MISVCLVLYLKFEIFLEKDGLLYTQSHNECVYYLFSVLSRVYLAVQRTKDIRSEQTAVACTKSSPVLDCSFQVHSPDNCRRWKSLHKNRMDKVIFRTHLLHKDGNPAPTIKATGIIAHELIPPLPLPSLLTSIINLVKKQVVSSLEKRYRSSAISSLRGVFTGFSFSVRVDTDCIGSSPHQHRNNE